MEKEILVTREGLEKMQSELEYLKTVKRQEVSQRIKQAIEFGDISENSEYEDAKNEQAFIEGKIASLEKKLRNVRLIDDKAVKAGIVSLGARVKIKDLEYGDEFEYTIVGSTEADPLEAKISNESPVGKAILGKKVGEVVDVTVPDGTLRYQIVGINC
jgi:transcription elongation factor GreA